MEKFLKLICSGAVLLTATSSIFADTDSVSQSSKPSQYKPSKGQQAVPFEQGLGLPDGKYPAAYNAPACIDTKGSWDVDLFGSFIYWHVSQENMDVAYSALAPLLGQTTPAVAYQPFKYKPGFKVGLGIDLNYDGWVSWAEYTWLHQTTRSTQTPPTAVPGPAIWSTDSWVTSTALASPAVTSSWKMNFDMVDVVFSRPYYEGMQLTVSPYAGMRALWLRQKVNLVFAPSAGSLNPAANGIRESSNNQSRCWSLGPVAGVLGHWLLGLGFRFEGNSTISLLYTRYTKIVHSQFSSASLLPATYSSSTRNLSALRPIAQIGVGLGWGSYFGDGGYYVDISARYDFSYFWNQNMMRQYVATLEGDTAPAGDLEMHGLTANLRVDF